MRAVWHDRARALRKNGLTPHELAGLFSVTPGWARIVSDERAYAERLEYERTGRFLDRARMVDACRDYGYPGCRWTYEERV